MQTATADVNGDDETVLPFRGNPNPLLIRLATDEGPQLIALDHQAFFWWQGRHSTFRGVC